MKIPKKITTRYARNKFNTVGLCLILYALLILFVPIVLRKYLSYKYPQLISSPLMYLDICVLMLIVFTVIPFLIMRKSFDIDLESIFKKTKKSSIDLDDEAIVFFLVSSLAIFISTSIFSRFGYSGTIVYNIGSFSMEEYYGNILYGLIFVVISPILEEYAFRGVLQKSLSRFGKLFALIVSSLIYALAHNSFAEMIPSFVTGYFLGKIALFSDSVRPCIRLHIFLNLVLYLLCITPDRFGIYLIIFLVVSYIAGIVKIIKHKHITLSFKRNKNTLLITKTFVLSFSVIVALILFIGHSILVLFI